jgi:oligopeptide/dipeptide ABC transporter ATP-binding protein
MDTNELLQVQHLKTYFFLDQGTLRAVDDVSFSLSEGKTLGIVGESGCGKSITVRSILRLLPHPVGRVVSGQIDYRLPNGRIVDLAAMDPVGAEIRAIRGNEIAMIFQEPMTSLNPVYTIGDQIIEAVRLHERLSYKQARARAIEMLKRVSIPEAERRVDQYPHQFSGGMRQRAMIAMALSCNPRLLIADEPTTALDVTIEAQILALIRDLQQQDKMALIMITHDLNVIGEMADKVIVMYLGRIVEQTTVDGIFDAPRHPYTQGLLRSLPRIGHKERLIPIEGSVPNAYGRIKGCSFAARCPNVMDKCREQTPPLIQIAPETTVACWLYTDASEVGTHD